MLSFQGKRLVEVGDSPLVLGSRSVGDPFPQYWHKQLPLGTVGGPALIVNGPVDFMDCPTRFNVNNGSCDPIVTIHDSTSVLPNTYIQLGTVGSVQQGTASELVVRSTTGDLDLIGIFNMTLTTGLGAIGVDAKTTFDITHVLGMTVASSSFKGLVVEDLGGVDVFRADPANKMVVVGDGPTTTACLSIGEQGAGVVAGYGIYKQSPGGIYFNGDTRVVMSNPPTELDRIVFGTPVGLPIGENTFEFSQDVQFRGGFALDRITVSALNNVLPIAAEYTYVGYNGIDQAATITLPPTQTMYGSSGAKPGQLIVVKDERGSGNQTQDLTLNTPDGALIDGAASRTLGQGGFYWLQSDGVDWRVIGS